VITHHQRGRKIMPMRTADCVKRRASSSRLARAASPGSSARSKGESLTNKRIGTVAAVYHRAVGAEQIAGGIASAQHSLLHSRTPRPRKEAPGRRQTSACEINRQALKTRDPTTRSEECALVDGNKFYSRAICSVQRKIEVNLTSAPI